MKILHAARISYRFVPFAVFVAFGFSPIATAQDKRASEEAPTERSSYSREGRSSPPSREVAEGPGFIRLRAEWFFKQRAFPLGYIPAGARLKATQHLERMLQQSLLEQRAATVVAESNAPPPLPNPTTWTAIGPQGTLSFFFVPFTSGRVTALAVNPKSANNVYLGAADGGLWITSDGGQNWTPLTDTQPTQAVGSIAIDTATCSATGCQTIYLGTGEENFAGDNIYGAGVLKTTDGGQTWTQDKTFVTSSPLDQSRGGPMIGALSINPANHQVLLAAVEGSFASGSGLQSGIWRSTDGGANWTRAILPVSGQLIATDVLFDPNDTTGMIAYAGLSTIVVNGVTGSGVFKSTDGGITWKQLSLGIADTTVIGRIALAIAPSNSAILYAAVADSRTASSHLLGVFKTTNANAASPTWTQLNDPQGLVTARGFCNPQCFYDLVIKVSPADPNVVFAGGAAANATLIRSLDGGNNWVEVSGNRGTAVNGLHVDTHAIAFSSDGSKIYVGNDGGVWGQTNPTGSIAWSNLNAALNITQFYPGHTIHPSTPNISYGGTQDNGLQQYAGDLNWQDLGVGCDGGWTALDTMIPTTFYGECEYIPGFLLLIFRSFTNGILFNNTGDLVVAGIDGTDRGSFIPPLVIDPENPQTLYFGTFRVYQTTNGANSWKAISPDLTGFNPNVFLTAIAVAPKNSAVVYAGTRSGRLSVTTNATAASPAWTDITSSLPLRSMTQIAVDPSDPTGRVAYVTNSGFSGVFPNPTGGTIGDTRGHVFKTSDGGATWTDISCTAMDCSKPNATDLPNIPVNDIVIEPDDPTRDTLYVATDIGVFATTNGGAKWAPFGSGLPRAEVLSLRLHDPSRMLRAVTHGRGAWDLLLPSLAGTPTFVLGSISPASATAGNGPLVLTVNGNGFTSSSVIKWNGSTNGVTFLDHSGVPTQLKATIQGNLTSTAGTVQVTVDQTGTGPVSNQMIFAVENPVPSITGTSPNTAVAGQSADITATVLGANFTSTSQVNWQGSPNGITTAFTDPVHLQATISHTLLAFGGNIPVTVVSPQPGGGMSKPALLFTVAQTNPPPNDNFANATPVTSTNNTYTNTVDNFAATTESTDPFPSCVPTIVLGAPNNPRTKTVWWKFTANGTGAIEADTIGSPYDTTLSVWTGSQGNLVQVACNDDIQPGVITQSRVTFNATQGTTYLFMVAPFGTADPPSEQGGKTVFNLTTNLTVAPDFNLGSPTATQTVNAGQSATYTITVSAMNGTFSGTVTLSCTAGVPSQAFCSFNPVSVTPNAGSVNSTLTIATTARSSAPNAPAGRGRPLPNLWAIPLALMLAAIALAARVTGKRRWAVYLPLSVVLLLAFQAFGCGGGGGGGTTPPSPSGTPGGTYTITVTGASGATTHTTTVGLMVN